MAEVRKFGKKEFDYYVSKLSRGSERDRKRAGELLNQYERWVNEGYSPDDAARKALASVQLKTAIEMKKKTGESYWDKVRGRILTQHQKHARYTARFKEGFGESQAEEIQTRGIQTNIVCPNCGATNLITSGVPGHLVCPACGKTFPAKMRTTSAASSIVHFSFVPIVVGGVIGALIPILLSDMFGTLGTTLIGVGIFFLGLSKM